MTVGFIFVQIRYKNEWQAILTRNVVVAASPLYDLRERLDHVGFSLFSWKRCTMHTHSLAHTK